MELKENKTEIIFRLDAGTKIGFGHLSRCLSLAQEFVNEFHVWLIIRTEEEDKVFKFINNFIGLKSFKKIEILKIDVSVEDELLYLRSIIKNNNGFLILDHYSIDQSYQLFLKKNNIQWMQFDSHAKIKFYGDIVLHASPAATVKLYKPLLRNSYTKLLLGTRFAIMNKEFQNKIAKVKSRDKVKNIFMCFGGGDAKGAVLKCLDLIDKEIFQSISIFLLINSNNPDINILKGKAENNNNIRLVINSMEVVNFMLSCDLAIIAPGMMSYEAACLGLPMLLVTIADNQVLNAKGWVDIGCAINLGAIEELEKNRINKELKLLINNPEKLKEMSVNCIKNVDAYGASRVKNEIVSIL